MTIIALLSDFGTRDPYVGVMKGVIAGIAPEARVIDLTHELSPHQVSEGAYTLRASFRYFPKGTVFCAVVDPGVGGERLGIAARLRSSRYGPYQLVCPDNGLLTPLLSSLPAEAVAVLDNPRYHLPEVSVTFHGRDLFAPVAAHLANGAEVEALGSRRDPAQLRALDWPGPAQRGEIWLAHVLHIDRFGNLISDLPGDALEPPLSGWQVKLGERVSTPIRRTFADVALGEPVAYLGSSGLVELALREDSAARVWGVSVGDRLELIRRA